MSGATVVFLSRADFLGWRRGEGLAEEEEAGDDVWGTVVGCTTVAGGGDGAGGMAVTVTDATTAGDGKHDVPAEDGADGVAAVVLFTFLAATVRFVMFLLIDSASALEAKRDFRRGIVPFLMFAFKWLSQAPPSSGIGSPHIRH